MTSHSQFKTLEKGFASVLILILFATFSAFGLEAYLKAQTENRMAKREAISRQALYTAEGGIEWVKAELLTDPLFAGGRHRIGEGEAEINVTLGEGGYWVTSDAQYGLAHRKLKVFLQLDQGRWVMSQYQELYQ
ncbi:hypothetical protein AusDCA_0871 [Desulfitobacterium sp. AusDCA]